MAVKRKRPPRNYDFTSKAKLIQALHAVLGKHTDNDYTLRSAEIARLLWEEHGIYMNNKDGNAVALATKKITTCLRELMISDERIECCYRPNRKIDEYEEYTVDDVLSGMPAPKDCNWKLTRELSDSELLHLINLQRFSKYIDYLSSRKLARKLENLSSIHFKEKHKYDMPRTKIDRHEKIPIFYLIEQINRAIVKGKQISFKCCTYQLNETTCRVAPLIDDEEIIISPYGLIMSNSRYYVICSYPDKDKAYFWRLDYMRDIVVLDGESDSPDIPARPDVPPRPVDEITELRQDKTFTQFVNERIYMVYRKDGKSVRVKFRASKNMLLQVLDWFGDRVMFETVTDDSFTASVPVYDQAMVYWALQYSPSVEVLEPEYVREMVIEAVRKTCGQYGLKVT